MKKKGESKKKRRLIKRDRRDTAKIVMMTIKKKGESLKKASASKEGPTGY